jgi:alkylation response protein AidB-like acyl-CoA dehydrogenase
VHFAFSDQQLEFRDAVHQVLVRECTTVDLREAYRAPAARTPRWSVLADLGVTGLAVPVERGGLGLGMVDLVLLLEEAGRVALPEPLVETAALAAPLLDAIARAGGPGAAMAAGWLDRIPTGALAAGVGTNRNPGDPIAGADGADLLLLAATGAGGPAIHGLEAGTCGVRPVPSLDPTRRLGVPEWEPTQATLLVAGPYAVALVAGIADRAAVAVAAELLGLTRTMVTLAAEFARERHQFGRPIGSFQAVKHLLAGAEVLLEFARPAVYAAAWALDAGAGDASRSASVAKAYASEAALEAARVSLQVHGAIGYTWECDLHLFLKRAWALAESWGSAADHRALLLESLLVGR